MTPPLFSLLRHAFFAELRRRRASFSCLLLLRRHAVDIASFRLFAAMPPEPPRIDSPQPTLSPPTIISEFEIGYRLPNTRC
jgi:hypothetical protein